MSLASDKAYPKGSLNGKDVATRVDLEVIAELVTPGAKVLDIGCGDGALLELLARTRRVDGRGIELSRSGVNETVARGLSVVQGDADADLGFYPNDAYDFVILSQTLQATRNPKLVLEHLLRIGRRAIVSFPNFGHWRVRAQIALGGHMPMSHALPHAWYETPNIHHCTITDFLSLCEIVNAHVETAVVLNERGRRIAFGSPFGFWNMFGKQAVFLLCR